MGRGNKQDFKIHQKNTPIICKALDFLFLSFLTVKANLKHIAKQQKGRRIKSSNSRGSTDYNECNPQERNSGSQFNNYVIMLHLRSIAIHSLLIIFLKIFTTQHGCHAELKNILTSSSLYTLREPQKKINKISRLLIS